MRILCLSLVCLGLHSLTMAMDLRQALERARQTDPAFQATQQELQALAQVLPQARAGLLPSVAANASRNRVSLNREQDGASLESSYYSENNTLQLRQPLWRRPQWAQLQQARTQAASAEPLGRRAQGDLLLRVASAYFDVLYAGQSLAYVQALAAASQQQLQAARRGFALGQGTRTDIDEAQARFDQAAAQSVQARQNEAYARSQLSMLVGQGHGPLWTLSIDEARPPLFEGSLQTWLDRARESNPDIQLARTRLDVAALEVTKNQAGHDPTLDLVAQRSISKSENPLFPRSNFYTSQVGVQLTVPVYSGGATTAAVHQAVANRERAHFELEQAINEVLLKVQREFHAVAEGPERLQAARQAVHSAAQLVLSVGKGIQAGTRTISDQLNAIQREADARRELSLVVYQLHLSRLRLGVLCGEDLPAVVEALNRQLRTPPHPGSVAAAGSGAP